MKKYLSYTVLLITGLFIGWLLFGTSSDQEAVSKEEETTQTNQMWTCAMHPQIMQPDPGKCPICGMELIPATTDSGGLTANQFKLTDHAMALANIQTEIVGIGNVTENTVTLSGRIDENEEANTVQISFFSGRIQGLNVNFTGEKIRKGQLLATIYSPELYAAQQELLTASTLRDSQPELYAAVRNKLKLWKLTDSQIDEIESSGKVKEYLPVFATVAGTVTEKLVEKGDFIKQGQPLLKIADLNTVWANFDVYENQLDYFRKGQTVLVRSNAHPNREFKGKVDFIDPVLQTNTRTVTLRVVLNNKNDIFKPGMFVSAEIKIDKAGTSDRISIPSSAVLWTGKRSVVYLKPIKDVPVFEMREVVLGNQVDDQYEVVEGLSSGDEIVTNGTFSVDAAAQLQGKKSMMNQKVSGSMKGHETHGGIKNVNQVAQKEAGDTADRLHVPVQFQQQLNIVYNSYINIKDALVINDASEVTFAAKELLKGLEGTDMKLLDNEARHHWMGLEKGITSTATSISQSSEIETQRKQFKNLSAHLIRAVELFGVNEKVYVEFCPMADNNNGGYWLSKEEKVYNPYFGEAMLTCGEVKEVLE